MSMLKPVLTLINYKFKRQKNKILNKNLINQPKMIKKKSRKKIYKINKKTNNKISRIKILKNKNQKKRKNYNNSKSSKFKTKKQCWKTNPKMKNWGMKKLIKRKNISFQILNWFKQNY